MIPSDLDRRLVDAICDIDEGLDAYQLQFVESAAQRVDRGLPLTDRQREFAAELLRNAGRSVPR